MTAHRLPRSARGKALPRRAGTDTVDWPPALRGRSTWLCLLLLGWLGGGLLATAVATVTEKPNDLAYGLVNVTAALVGLLALVLVGLRERRGAAPGTAPTAPAPGAPVPVQARAAHDDRREPALR